MVELVDTQASEACFLKQEVGVQVSLAAHDKTRTWWNLPIGRQAVYLPAEGGHTSLRSYVLCLRIEK